MDGVGTSLLAVVFVWFWQMCGSGVMEERTWWTKLFLERVRAMVWMFGIYNERSLLRGM